MKIGSSVTLTFLTLASEALANCWGPYNAPRFIPGWGIDAQTVQFPETGIIAGYCNTGCNYGPNFGEYLRGISGPHIFGAGQGFGPVRHVSGVGVPNNFWGGPGYPGNLGDQTGTIGELSYVPSDATNPMLNFWGGSFPPGVPGVPGSLGGLGGLGFDAGQGEFPGFHGFGGFPGVFGPPIRAEVAGQGFRGPNGQPAAIALPPAGDDTLGLDSSGSRLLSALENGEGRGSSKKSNRQSSKNRNRNRNVNMNFNKA